MCWGNYLREVNGFNLVRAIYLQSATTVTYHYRIHSMYCVKRWYITKITEFLTSLQYHSLSKTMHLASNVDRPRRLCLVWSASPLGSAGLRGMCVLSFVGVAEVGGVSCQFSGCNLLFLLGCTAWMSIREGLCSAIFISVTSGWSLWRASREWTCFVPAHAGMFRARWTLWCWRFCVEGTQGYITYKVTLGNFRRDLSGGVDREGVHVCYGVCIKPIRQANLTRKYPKISRFKLATAMLLLKTSHARFCF